MYSNQFICYMSQKSMSFVTLLTTGGNLVTSRPKSFHLSVNFARQKVAFVLLPTNLTVNCPIGSSELSLKTYIFYNFTFFKFKNPLLSYPRESRSQDGEIRIAYRFVWRTQKTTSVETPLNYRRKSGHQWAEIVSSIGEFCATSSLPTSPGIHPHLTAGGSRIILSTVVLRRLHNRLVFRCFESWKDSICSAE